mgnify:CR=1 FL=1
MQGRLVDATVETEATTAIDEVVTLFKQIKEAWDSGIEPIRTFELEQNELSPFRGL